MVAMMAATAIAGGLMTNTNYHIAFDRMMARGASFDIDAAYSNPAGLAWGHEGFQLSLNFQKPWQYRNIEMTQPQNLRGQGVSSHRSCTVRLLQEGSLGYLNDDWYRG